MIARIACWSVLFLLPLALSGCVPDSMVASVNKLSTDVSQTAEQQKKLSETVTSDVPDLKRKVNELATKLNDTVIAQNDKIEAIKNLNEQTSKLHEEMLAQISRRDQNGRSIPDIWGSLQQSREFQADFAAAVRRVAPIVEQSHGTLIVTNRTEVDRYIWVNGVGHWISSRASATLRVPVGTVSTHVSGERVKFWSVSPPTYEVAIDIVPRAIRAYPLESYPEEIIYLQ